MHTNVIADLNIKADEIDYKMVYIAVIPHEESLFRRSLCSQCPCGFLCYLRCCHCMIVKLIARII